MSCLRCGGLAVNGYKLADGRYSCEKCIVVCETKNCSNLAYFRKIRVSNCHECWDRKLAELQRPLDERYEKELFEWKEKSKNRPWRLKKPVRKSAIGYFCPDCGAVLDSKKCFAAWCNIEKIIELAPVKKTQRQDDNMQNSANMNDNLGLIFGLFSAKEIRNFEKIIFQQVGYFEWPTTDISPRWDGRAILSSDGWPNASPLKILGYNVSQKENLSQKKRQQILEFTFASSRLPWVDDQDYMMKWGAAESPARLKRMADHLATMGRNQSLKKHLKALKKYDDDLEFLKIRFYDPMAFEFGWPNTDTYE